MSQTFLYTPMSILEIKNLFKRSGPDYSWIPLTFSQLRFCLSTQFSLFFLGGSGWRYPVACVSLHIAASSWPPSASSHPSPERENSTRRERMMDSGNHGPWRCCYSYVWWMLHICFPCIKCLWLLRTKKFQKINECLKFKIKRTNDKCEILWRFGLI